MRKSKSLVILGKSVEKEVIMGTQDLQSEFQNLYGPVIGGKDLMQLMGFRTKPAFRRAVRDGVLGVRVFEMPGRQGKYAMTKDVAVFISQCNTTKEEG